MSKLETVSLTYLCAGLTCWLVLAVAYMRIGQRSPHAGPAIRKAILALPVVVLWPLLVLALRRHEKAERRTGAVRMKQDEPSQGPS
ncbi:MAG: hypothetical protein M3552_04000 [Planctomycetota bacterium]|nr:hypothetical protein [Planctomycetaceae bacterium]MDQ3329804.1 hypothetical protein [Planctomycetota bacterium]